MTTDTLTTEALTDLAVRALQSYGLSPGHARQTTEILVLADMFGLHTHGVSRIQSYGDRLALGGINPSPDIVVNQVAPAVSQIDGDNGVGPLVGQAGLREALRLARDAGVGMAFARGSNHFGPISPYSFLAANRGFASFICSNATTTIAPWGGRDARLGNNPMGFGAPNPGGAPFLLDMAISVAARAKIRQALKTGTRIPETWATDREGRPTSDPQAALGGFLLALGGHKGYGLALMVDLLAGVLSGASYLTRVKSWVDEPDLPQNLGHFFLIIDVSRLGGEQWLAERMQDFRSILHDTPAAEPDKPVLVPGEIELAHHDRARREGVEIDAATLAHLRERSAMVSGH